MDDETKALVQSMIDQALKPITAFETRKRGDTPTDATQLTPKRYVDGAIASVYGSVLASFGNLSFGITGDGSDGAALFDGVSSVNGATLAGSTYRINRNVFYTNVSVSSTIAVNPGQNLIFANRSIVNAGSIISIGGNGVSGSVGGSYTAGSGTTALGGTGGNPGASVLTGYLPTALVGSFGARGANGIFSAIQNLNGNPGNTPSTVGVVTHSFFTISGGQGGTSGSSGGATALSGGAGASGGPGGVSSVYLQRPATYPRYLDMTDFDPAGPTLFMYEGAPTSGGGAGGAGGAAVISPASTFPNGGGAGGGGGGSGAPGGIITLFTPSLTNSGLISVRGGDGGNGGNGGNGDGQGGGGGGGGGGAGGNGGVIFYVTARLTNTGTMDTSGGSPGTGGTAGTGQISGNNGSSGAPGNSGIIYPVLLNN